MRAKISRPRVEQYSQQLRGLRGCPLRGQQMLQVLSATSPNLPSTFDPVSFDSESFGSESFDSELTTEGLVAGCGSIFDILRFAVPTMCGFI